MNSPDVIFSHELLSHCPLLYPGLDNITWFKQCSHKYFQRVQKCHLRCILFLDAKKKRLQKKALETLRVTTLLCTSPLSSLSWYVMRDRRLFSQRMSSCAVPTHRASLLPASMLQALFGHRQASWGHGNPADPHPCTQAGRQTGSLQSHWHGDSEKINEFHPRGQTCLNLVKQCEQTCAWMFFFFIDWNDLSVYLFNCLRFRHPGGLLYFHLGWRFDSVSSICIFQNSYS